MNKVTVVFEGSSSAEVESLIAAHAAKGGSTSTVSAPKEAVQGGDKAPKTAKKAAAATAPAAAPVAEEEDPFAASGEEAADEGEAPTVESVNELLTRLNKEKGVTKVREALAKVKIKKVSEIGEAHLQPLHDFCTEALK